MQWSIKGNRRFRLDITIAIQDLSEMDNKSTQYKVEVTNIGPKLCHITWRNTIGMRGMNKCIHRVQSKERNLYVLIFKGSGIQLQGENEVMQKGVLRIASTNLR